MIALCSGIKEGRCRQTPADYVGGRNYQGLIQESTTSDANVFLGIECDCMLYIRSNLG